MFTLNRIDNKLAIALILCFGLFNRNANCQITNVTDQTQTPIPNVGHDYEHVLNETVNPANGSVNISIGIPTPPQGPGPQLPLGISYNSNQAITLSPGSNGSIAAGPSGNFPTGLAGWTVPGPYVTAVTNLKSQKTGNTPPVYINCNYLSNFVFTDRSGAPHALNLSQTYASSGCSQMTSPPINYGSGGDGYVLATIASFTLTVTEQDGTQLTFSLPNSIGGTGTTSTMLPQTITDAHGNSPAPTFTTNGTAFARPTQFTVYGLATSYGLTWQTSFANSTGSWAPGFVQAWPDGTATCSPPTYATAYNVGLGALTLPNGEAYGFQYDAVTGLLKKVTYPSGATITYTWQVNVGNVTNWTDSVGSASLGCVYKYGTPALLSRTISYDGVNPAQEQDYTYVTNWDVNTSYQWDSKSTTVITKDCTKASSCGSAPSFKTVYTYTPCPTGACGQTNNNDPNAGSQNVGYLPPETPLESNVQTYDWTGGLLKTVAKQWYSASYPKSIQTTLASGQVSKTTYPGWCAPSVPSEEDDYDWGSGAPGALLKKKVLSPTGGYTGRLAAACIPASSSVYDGSGNLVAQTKFAYNFPLNDPLSITHCLIQAGACAAASPKTSYTYYSTGLVNTMTKPCGNGACSDISGGSFLTTYYYTSYPAGNVSGNPSIPYLTQITHPTTSNGVAHVEKYGYNPVDGQLTSSLDENQATTTYKYGTQPPNCSYQDELDRMTEIDYADGGKGTYCYHDGAYSPGGSVPNVMTSVLQNSSNQWTWTSSTSDGVGHVVRTQSSDTPSPDNVDITYDGEGQVATRSNPYRGSSTGSVTYSYDSLGRPLKLTEQDGAYQQWCYDCGSHLGGVSTGTWVNVTDETSNQWQRTYNVLGEITDVMEPSGTVQSPTMETDYFYNALGDLTKVNQCGALCHGVFFPISRSFTYDALSRLTQAYNPESGWVCYGTTGNAPANGSNCTVGYDLDGNLASKTDARGVSTSYSYDSLDRITGKSYAAPSPAPSGYATTASVSYSYDQGCLCIYPIGRRTGMTDGAGTQAWGYYSAGTIFSMNRSTNTPIGTLTFGTSAQYNLDRTINNGSFWVGGTSYVYSYDAAGRATGVSQNNNGTVYPYASGAVYTPDGQLQSLVQGGGSTGSPTINTSVSYNSRLQPILKSVATTSQTLYSHSLCYVNCYSGSPTQNNGNLLYDADNVNAANTATYKYDTLNRLISAQTPTIWGDSYSYDGFGNLYAKTPAGSGIGESLVAMPTAQNQLSGIGLTYDANGNVLVDNLGTHYTFDAENRVATAGGWSYSYDGDGRRVLKTTGGTTGTTYWYGPDGSLTDEQDLPPSPSQGGNQQRLFYLNGHMVYRSGFPNCSYCIYPDYFVVYDQIGSTRLSIDVNGNPSQMNYYPFGTVLPSSVQKIAQGFTGKERDTESGNDYFEARYYASSMGRFLSPDWSAQEEPVPYAKLDDPQSLNLYAYVENNPLVRADADGHDGDGCCDFTFPTIEEPMMPPLPNPFHPLVPYPEEYTLTPEKLQQGLSDLGDSISSFFQKIYGAGRKFYPDDKKKIADDANHTCQNPSCGVATVPAKKSATGVTPPANEGQTDHKKAKSKGGTNHPSNGQHLCRKCNRAKSDSDTPPAPAPAPPPPPPPTPPPTGE